MISGTTFQIVDWLVLQETWQSLCPKLLLTSDLEEMAAQSRAGEILCLAGPLGFMAVELKPQDGLLELWIRMASSSVLGAFHKAESDLVSIARDLGASTIAFGPGRRGWAKLVGPQWSLRDGEYVRQVDVEAEVPDHQGNAPGQGPG